MDALGVAVGAVIQALRKKKGITQQEMAKVLRITQGSYSRLESGFSNLNVLQLRIAARHLGTRGSSIVAKAERQTQVVKNTRKET